MRLILASGLHEISPHCERCRPQATRAAETQKLSRSRKHSVGAAGSAQRAAADLLSAAIYSLPATLIAAPAHAAEAGAALPLALGGGVAITALSAALVATDPGARRRKQTADSGGNEKEAVRNYFNTKGFERWNRIYSQAEDVNKVQLDIREGHAQTVEKTLGWLDARSVEGASVCDAGCGTGSLAIPLALRGAAVSASDISQAMADEAARRYQAAVGGGAARPPTEPRFGTSDLESLSGRFDVVTCLDVMIHYPQADADKMISHLAGLAEKKLIISFAPKTLQYTILKRIGELFPGPAKATRAYLHAEADVERALNQAGFRVERREMTATSFYFSRLLEAVRV